MQSPQGMNVLEDFKITAMRLTWLETKKCQGEWYIRAVAEG